MDDFRLCNRRNNNNTDVVVKYFLLDHCFTDHNNCNNTNVLLVCHWLLCYEDSQILQHSNKHVGHCSHRHSSLDSFSGLFFEFKDKDFRRILLWKLTDF